MSSETQHSNSQGHVTLSSENRNGILAGFGCYIFWGLCPLYWKMLDDVNSFEVIAHRIIWCFVFTAVTCIIMKSHFLELFKNPRARKYLIPAAIVVTANWSIYILAVSFDHIVEASLGYYINPLVSILLGVLIFKERLSKLQIFSVLLCVFGITYFTVSYGSFPWIAILLAGTFGSYGAIKKKAGYPAIKALAFENTVMLIPAIVFAIVLANVTGSHSFMADTATLHGWSLTILLIVGGAVTAIPLIMFAKAANDIPLSYMGFMQFVNPTISLLLGVFWNGEPFTTAHLICFGCIWTACLLVAFETVRNYK